MDDGWSDDARAARAAFMNAFFGALQVVAMVPLATPPTDCLLNGAIRAAKRFLEANSR